MFSKKMMMIVGLITLIAVNIIILSITSDRSSWFGSDPTVISFVAPFQKFVTSTIRSVRDLWGHYFYLVSVTKENEALKRKLRLAVEKNEYFKEVVQTNVRLRELLRFRKTMPLNLLAAEIVGKDPSPWIKTAIIDKGRVDGVRKGSPVVVPEGVVGQIIEVAQHYARVLMVIDQNSAVDVVIQRNRARGIIKGETTGRTVLKYALLKYDIRQGDTAVSSGLDGVFPKGLQVGIVSHVIRKNSEMFQEITVTPVVDFEKLEEVLVVLNFPKHQFSSEK